jgi:flagellar motor switch protein FliG
MLKAEVDKIYKDLTKVQKAALLLIALGQKWATEIMRQLSEEEVRQLSYWINQMRYVPQEITERVIKEFYERLSEMTSLSTTGGKDYLLSVLGSVMGDQQAGVFVDELLTQEKNQVFRVLKQVDPLQLAGYLKSEQPQTIALMLSYLPPGRSATIIEALPGELQLDVIVCLAHMGAPDPAMVEAVESTLTKNLASIIGGGQKASQAVAPAGGGAQGGIKLVAELINGLSKDSEKALMARMAEKEFDLAAKIKEMMFVFEDLILLDDKSLQKVLKDVEQGDLLLALKGGSETIRTKIYNNISKRQAETIRDELSFMGPVKGATVRASQQKIINIVRKLDEEGQIVIQSKGGGGGGGDDEVFT